MAPLAGVVLAHGGFVGALVEAVFAVAVVGAFAAIWLRERRVRKARPPAKLRDAGERE